HEINQVVFRKKARKYAAKYVKIQCEEFKRLGIFGEWDNPYLTMSNEYEAEIARLFGELYLKGYIYQGSKPIYWSWACETALAEAEVEYAPHTSPSIYVKFPVIKDPSGFTAGYANTSIVIWTTTPWTLPSNLAIAVKEEFIYSLIETEKGFFIVAQDLITDFCQKIGAVSYKEQRTAKGAELDELVTKHPFVNRHSPVVLGHHVTLEQGTGCVHIAPGHGQEDYEIGLKYNLDILSPVDNQGKFYDSVEHFGGMFVFDANKHIISLLSDTGFLLFHEDITHSYPHCWRSHTPIIFRATAQWFINVDALNMRANALESVKTTRWIPEVGEKRITSMLENRPDWCLSRQRLWGVPIPVIKCESCGKHIMTADTLKKITGIFLKESSDAWFSYSVEQLLGSSFACPHCSASGNFTKEEDIIDVWFDSGVSHQAVLKLRDNVSYPADLYLEGSDQHRGWFQSSLLTAIGITGTAPFKTVLTHGFVVDVKGYKMSKSAGNIVSPQDIIKQYGADILRLWVASVDYSGDVRISDTILSQLSDSYRRIRNTFKFILGNIADFTPEKHTVPYESLDELDRWIVSRLHSLGVQVNEYYESFQFYKIFQAIHNFCVIELSSFYLDVLKDRMYISHTDDPLRRSSQTAMNQILETLMLLLAPILPFTTEEVMQYYRKSNNRFPYDSVHLSDWPCFTATAINKPLEDKWDRILTSRIEVQKILELYRKDKTIGSSLEAKVVLYTSSAEWYDFLLKLEPQLPFLYIVSSVSVSNVKFSDITYHESDKIHGLFIGVTPAEGQKCSRCWNYKKDTDTYSEYPNICGRCVNAIKGLF
ncbi:isoleucine--tRNA ligase, partial [bacterium]|nr:isoleucine--tRNA ligase [bacterium]